MQNEGKMKTTDHVDCCKEFLSIYRVISIIEYVLRLNFTQVSLNSVPVSLFTFSSQ